MSFGGKHSSFLNNECSFSQPPFHLENEVFLLIQFLQEKDKYSLLASGGNGVSGIGGGSNGEDVAIEVEELLIMLAKVASLTMVLHADQFSRNNNRAVPGAVLISLS